jgi:hypothetical protein
LHFYNIDVKMLPHVVVIEVKMSEKWDRSWEAPMRDLAFLAGIKVEGMYGIYTGPRIYRFDGLNVLPALDFLRALHRGEIF